MYKENMNYENQQRMIFDMVNEFGIPEIQPTKYEPCEFIGFNQAKTCKDRAGKGVHFFLDDYQFQRLWNRPDTYINMLSQFRFVMSPDFGSVFQILPYLYWQFLRSYILHLTDVWLLPPDG